MHSSFFALALASTAITLGICASRRHWFGRIAIRGGAFAKTTHQFRDDRAKAQPAAGDIDAQCNAASRTG